MVQLKTKSEGELKRLGRRLTEVAETKPVAEIFALLSGRKIVD
jgi:hypothetical protein